MPNDVLDDLLNSDDPEFTDEDTSDAGEDASLSNLLGEGDDAGAPAEEAVDLKSLQAQIDEYKREKDGLLKGIQEERKKRQEFKGRLDQLSSTVNAILEKKIKGDADPTGATKKISGIQVEFDEDGNAYLPSEKLAAVLTPYQRKIMELENQTTATAQATRAEKASQQALQALLREDASYPAAYDSYQKAREWANNKVIEFQQANELEGPMLPELALDHVFTPEVEAEFTKQFPGADLESVVGNSKRAFRKALKGFATVSQTVEKPSLIEKKAPTDSRFQKVLKKPSGLGAAKNAKGADLSVSDRLSSLSATDIYDLSDKEIKALEQALLAEEKSDGIRF